MVCELYRLLSRSELIMYFEDFKAILFVSSIVGIFILGGHALMTEETRDTRLPGTYRMMQVECVNQLVTQDEYELPKAVHYCAGGNL